MPDDPRTAYPENPEGAAPQPRPGLDAKMKADHGEESYRGKGCWRATRR